ncbi:MAG: hypothetical protein M9958_12060 [Chitinophagales bacterium]|nr:hypothetical protein [Chitinophagales bacterium]
MKKILLIIGLGSLIAASCSSSRSGYTYFDDVYNNRPSYSQEKRRTVGYTDDRPSYQPSSSSNYTSPNSYEDNSNSRLYVDDEYSSGYGTYTERIRRFNSSNYGFDYYSPFYTGFNSGLNYGIGIGTGFGYSNYGSYGSSFWNPFYSSSIYFGWGRPSWNIGFNTWFTPTYFDPFYSYNNWGWGNWYSPYYNTWNPYWGWGGNNNHHHHNDYKPYQNNMYYGPRGSSYNNSYYNGSQYDGGKTGINRGPQNNSNPSVNPNNGSGNFKYTPKNTAPSNTPSPNINQGGKDKYQSKPNNVPDRYKNAVPDRYNRPENNATPNRGGSFGGSQGNGSTGKGSQNQSPQRSGGSMQRTNK